MGASTDAARAEVLASRQLLLVEVGRLEAAGRSAIDIPAKIRKSPVQTVALIAATGFVVLGGPKKTFQAARRAIFGPKADLPKSMLPEQIEKALKALGDDGNVVRGVLEREFVDYLEKNKGVREKRDLKGAVSELGGNILRPVSSEVGKRLAKELLKPEGGSFNSVMDRIQARRDGRKEESGGSDSGRFGSGWTPVARVAARARKGRKTK
ncbi:MAG TPA: hypothetical protein VF375_06810 [Candidatus Limnocylindrales bacterium]